MASNSQKDILPVHIDDKAGSAENITVKDEVSSKPTVKNEASSTAGPAGPFAGNPFDCSTMSGLLNDPSIKELAKQIEEDPSFNQMADKPEYLLLIMQQAMKIPNFKTMAMHLCNALLQDPSMSSMLQNFTYLPNPPNKQEIRARINENPSLKHILDEIEIGGPAAMMRYWNDEEVLKNLGLAMGINSNTGGAAASSDNPLRLDSPFSEVYKKLLVGFILKLNLVDYAHSRPFGQQSANLPFPFYRIGCSRSKSGSKLCVQETKPMAWRNALLHLLAKLEEEEKVNMAKLEEEKVNVTELERFKVKVPRFTKEIILVLYVHCIMSDMRRYNNISLRARRAYNRGGEVALAATIMAKKNELEDKIARMYRAKLGLKGILKQGFEEVKEDQDESALSMHLTL